MADLLPLTSRVPNHARCRRVPPGLLRRDATARYLDIGVSTLDRLNAAGLVPAPIRLGGSLCWSRAELSAWCARGCPSRATWGPIWAALLAARAK